METLCDNRSEFPVCGPVHRVVDGYSGVAVSREIAFIMKGCFECFRERIIGVFKVVYVFPKTEQFNWWHSRVVFHCDCICEVFRVDGWWAYNFCFAGDVNFFERFYIYGIVGVLACVVFVRVFLRFTLFIYDWLFCEKESVGPSLVECFLCC